MNLLGIADCRGNLVVFSFPACCSDVKVQRTSQPLSELSSRTRQREHSWLSKISPRLSFLISASPLLGLEAAAGMRFWQTTSKSKLLALWTEKHTLSPLTAASLQGNKPINEQEKRPGLESLAKQKGGGSWGCSCRLAGLVLQPCSHLGTSLCRWRGGEKGFAP